jgi:hypothetical protein
MKPSDKVKQLPEMMSLIEKLEDKLFSFYKSRDVHSGMVKDRIDEYNGIEVPLPEAYCSGMDHFDTPNITEYQDLERGCFVDIYFKELEEYKKVLRPGRFVDIDTLNVYQKVKIFDILEAYLVDLTKQLDLITIYVGLPKRTQEEIDRKSERILEQMRSWMGDSDDEMV